MARSRALTEMVQTANTLTATFVRACAVAAALVAWCPMTGLDAAVIEDASEDGSAPSEDVPAHEAPLHSSDKATDGTASFPSLNIIGFTDMNFFASDDPRLSPNSGFFEGQFVLHFTSALSERVGFVGELSLTARRDALQSAATPGFNPEVERVILKYDHNDHLKLSLGRYHTPINYWNVAFHHGQWLQTTVSRPEMIQFGGQFLPVHFVGALLEGSVQTGSWGLSYNAGLGNGRSTVISRAGDAADVNNNRAWTAGLSLKPGRWYGLQGGGAVYRDLVSLAQGRHSELILSGYLASTKESPEVIAEYARVRHRALTSGNVSRSSAYYLQLAYRLPRQKRWKPYLRWEHIRIAAGDEVFAALRSRKGFLAGLRLDAADLVAIKAEYRRQRSGIEPYVNGFFLQVSFTF